eukprot:1141468-Pelagomonas_calceolata.AAC.2
MIKKLTLSSCPGLVCQHLSWRAAHPAYTPEGPSTLLCANQVDGARQIIRVWHRVHEPQTHPSAATCSKK